MFFYFCLKTQAKLKRKLNWRNKFVYVKLNENRNRFNLFIYLFQATQPLGSNL
jgi:hypothetical protein